MCVLVEPNLVANKIGGAWPRCEDAKTMQFAGEKLLCENFLFLSVLGESLRSVLTRRVSLGLVQLLQLYGFCLRYKHLGISKFFRSEKVAAKSSNCKVFHLLNLGVMKRRATMERDLLDLVIQLGALLIEASKRAMDLHERDHVATDNVDVDRQSFLPLYEGCLRLNDLDP